MLQAGIRRGGWLIAGSWTLAVAFSLYTNIQHEYSSAEEQAAKVARANLNKDQAFRQWVSERGGLYGQVSPLLQTNPYLSHLPSQNINTSVGELTLLNPAYILRLLMDEYDALYGVKGRIVGLKALNPNNLADPWESKTIGRFQQDPKLEQYSEISEIDGKSYLRMMVPMYMKPDCMKCHAILGYQVGDLRGGVNVSVPLADFYAVAYKASLKLSATHGFIWLLGLFGIAFFALHALREATDREAFYQERLLAAHVFDGSLQGIMITDPDGCIERINPQFCQLTGYSAEEAIGKTPRLLKSGRHDAAFYAAMWGSLKSKGTWQGELLNRRKNGETFHVWESIVSVVDEQGKTLHYISLFEDITERKLAELALKNMNEVLEQRVQERTAELNATKEDAEKANLAKSKFLSQMSHELRTPLNAILGFSHLLETDKHQTLSQTQADDVREISKAGRHLLELIDEVLDLAKIEAGKLSVNIEATSLSEAVNEAASLIKPNCDASGIKLEITNLLASGTRIACDPIRLNQILLNFLSNAVKYNKVAGQIQLSVEAVGESRIRISVSDSGHGLNEGDLARLFNPFERLPQHAHIEGTGIGLALCKQLAAAMNSEIGVRSKPGVGTTFWIDLPKAEEATPPSAQETKPSIDPKQITKHPLRILYIEDNEANMRLVAKLLGHHGMHLIEANTPIKGLQLAQTQKPDLILLDIQMPEMSGFEVIAKLKSMDATCDIPVVGISANAMHSDAEKAHAAGFDAYLTKPLDFDKFYKVLNRVLIKN